MPTYVAEIPSAMAELGVWLYVLSVDSPKSELLYVGTTDTRNPLTRMGDHLAEPAYNPNRQVFEKYGTPLEECARIRLVAHGPLFPVGDGRGRDLQVYIAETLEKALADALAESGYCVVNNPQNRQPPELGLWAEVLGAFAAHFPGLNRAGGQ